MTHKLTVSVNDDQSEFLFFIEELFSTNKSKYIKNAISFSIYDMGFYPIEELKEIVSEMEKESTYDLGWRFSVTISDICYSYLEHISKKYNTPISQIVRLCLNWYMSYTNDFIQ